MWFMVCVRVVTSSLGTADYRARERTPRNGTAGPWPSAYEDHSGPSIEAPRENRGIISRAELLTRCVRRAFWVWELVAGGHGAGQ